MVQTASEVVDKELHTQVPVVEQAGLEQLQLTLHLYLFSLIQLQLEQGRLQVLLHQEETVVTVL